MGRTKASPRKGPEGFKARQAAKERKKAEIKVPNPNKGHKKKKPKKVEQKQQKNDVSDTGMQDSNTTDSIDAPEKIVEEPFTEDVVPKATTTRASLPNKSHKTNILTPKPFGDLSTTHYVAIFTFGSSSKIERKVTHILKHLDTVRDISPQEPSIAMLFSKAISVAKMISVVEIAKREITAKKGKWFQYNVTEQIMKVVERKPEKGGEGEGGAMDIDGDEKGEDEGDENEEDESFESMKTPFERAIEGKPKHRGIPTMTIYLSRARIDVLKRKYGEQTNSLGV